jgi:hypothetical protein
MALVDVPLKPREGNGSILEGLVAKEKKNLKRRRTRRPRRPRRPRKQEDQENKKTKETTKEIVNQDEKPKLSL